MIGTIFLLFFSISSFSYTSASFTQCRPDQRDALLEFKSEFELRNPPIFYVEISQHSWTWFNVTSYPKTKSWENNTDCCYWKGIRCDAKSGVVTGVDLSCSCLHGSFKQNSSLFRLRHLRNLNLAYNNFNGSSIPTRINKLMGLQRLNLSHSSFSGVIPTEILHLTKLVSLDLSSTYMSSQSHLSTEKPFFSQLAKNLTNLRELEMSYVNLTSGIPQIISNLTFLRSLHFHDCHLFGTLPRLSPTIRSIDLSINPHLESSLPEFSANNSLVHLDLSQTSLSGNIPDSISNLKHLKFLRFFRCKLKGKIPSSIGNLSQLTMLDLGFNSFAGEVSSSFQNLNQMSELDLWGNKLSGEIPAALFNLTKLSSLLLAYNHFTGMLPSNITSLSNLNYFDARSNSLVGTIPYTLFNIPSLESLYLGDNQFNGPLEIGNISSMSKLQWLDLSYFNTRGPLDIGIFCQLNSLEDLNLSHINTTTTIDLNAVLSSPLKWLYGLDLSGSHVSLEKMSSVSTFSSWLQLLYLTGCSITVFPEFIRSLQYIYILDLSNNNIKGQVPGWLWRLPELTNVNLSNNTFSGFKELPKDLSRTKIDIIDLSKNDFSGGIPISICRMTSLLLVYLSYNNFNGSVPQCISNLIKRDLTVLNLGNNHLSGELPDVFLKGSNLRSLDVGHNQLVGELPRSLSNCSSLEVLNIEHNRINDTFPFWLGSLPELQVLLLHSNEFHGSLQCNRKVAPFFPQLRIIDISRNGFTGTLPSDFFMYWSAMHSEGDRSELKYIGDGVFYQDSMVSMVLMNKGIELNYTKVLTLLTAIDLSGNRLQGIIPESIGQVKALKVLNLSSNGFVGNIPSSLENLVQMESLDLSHNKLSGHIPHGLAQLTSISTIRVSHNKLVGMIPQSTQFRTQNASGFEDNAGLCGPPLDQCRVGHDDTTLTQHDDEEEDAKEEEVLSWTAAAIGFLPGIVLGLIIGHLMLLYKPHWFFKLLNINDRRRRKVTPRSGFRGI